MCVAKSVSVGRQASNRRLTRLMARGENVTEVQLSSVTGGQIPGSSTRRVVSSGREDYQGVSCCWRMSEMILAMGRLAACNEPQG
jgi:hypothetical protein